MEIAAQAYLIDWFLANRVELTALSAQSDTIGRPTDGLMNLLLDQDIQLALVPLDKGGKGFRPSQEFEVIFAASAISGTLGWVVFQLCGNVGRAFSFFPDSVNEGLLQGTTCRPVICYHNNPVHGRLDGSRLNGRWPFGSLAAVATHFVAPYLTSDGRELCAIVPKEQVEVYEDWALPGLRGSSTFSYSVRDIALTSENSAPVACNNPGFQPWYSVPRASVKHAAHALGMVQSICNVPLAGNAAPGVAELFDWLRLELADRKASILALIGELEAALIDGRSADVLASLERKLVLANQHSHAWLLELAMSSYQLLPNFDGPARPLVLRNALDAQAISGHQAIRSAPVSVVDFLRSSPRLTALKASLADVS